MQETMHSFLVSLCVFFAGAGIILPGPARAETCPDFYRFVDFGQKGNEGTVYRGGTLLRAENFDGTMLLKLPATKCLPVQDTAKDGRGNPIPVATSIQYLPEKTAIKLTELNVSAVEDTNAAAEKNAERHRNELEQTDAIVTRGSNFLCVNNEEKNSLSCQVVSPYPGNIALVVYCDDIQCNMPVMAVDKQIAVDASWPRTSNSIGNDERAGAEIIEKSIQIHDFLKPLTSLNPG